MSKRPTGRAVGTAALKSKSLTVIRLASKAAAGDVDPLCDYLLSHKPLSRKDRQNIAWAIERLRTRGRRPIGPIGDVARAEDKAAHIVARRRDKWLAAHPERQRLLRGLKRKYAEEEKKRVKASPEVMAKMSVDRILIRLTHIRRD